MSVTEMGAGRRTLLCATVGPRHTYVSPPSPETLISLFCSLFFILRLAFFWLSSSWSHFITFRFSLTSTLTRTPTFHPPTTNSRSCITQRARRSTSDGSGRDFFPQNSKMESADSPPFSHAFLFHVAPKDMYV